MTQTQQDVLKASKEQCIFCKIVSGDIPSATIYEDDKVIAFLDINPVNAGHALVVPKEHYIVLPQLPDDLAMHLMKIVKYLSGAIFEMTGAHGINVYQNNGAAAGQEVPHVHFHVIPRRQGDQAIGEWKRNKIDPEQLKQIASEMGKNLKPIGSTVKLSSNTAVSKKKPKAKRKAKPVKLTKKRSA
jgi:histidine triad (HIT) family protein|tara:strand:- start:5933 stop:6490 length:558 start_codon:yes stop_codon:yes gene_type:complete